MKRFEVTWKRRLNHNMVWLKIYAPLVAKHAKPGQFIILRTDEFGERIPLTMAGLNEEDGSIDLIASDHAPHSAEEKGRGLEKSLMGGV